MAPDCQVMVVKGMKGVVWSKETRTGNDNKISVTACSKRCYRDAEDALKDPAGNIHPDATFRDIAEVWRDESSEYRIDGREAGGQYIVSRHKWLEYWLERIGDVQLDQITKKLVMDAFREVLTTRAASTAKKHKIVLAHVFQDALDRETYKGTNWGRVLPNPRDDKTQLVPKRNGKVVGKALWNEDYHRIKNEMNTDSFSDWNHYVAAMISMHTGLRMGEILALQDKHLIRNAHGVVDRILVEQEITRDKSGVSFVDDSTKGEESRTVGALDNLTLTELLDKNVRRQIEWRKETGFYFVHRGFVVCKGDGDFIKVATVGSRWAKLLRQLDPPLVWERVGQSDENGHRERKLMPPSFHELRHTFAAFGMAHGLTLPELQMALGHKLITTTEGYLTSDPQRLINTVINKIGDAKIG